MMDKKSLEADAAFLEELRTEFYDGAPGELDEWEQSLLSFESSGAIEHLKNLKRLIHSMKGSTQAIGLVEPASLLHDLEQWIFNAESGRSKNEIASVGLEFVDHLRSHFSAMRVGQDIESSMNELRELLKR